MTRRTRYKSAEDETGLNLASTEHSRKSEVHEGRYRGVVQITKQFFF